VSSKLAKAVTASVVAIVIVGCNSILDNTPGVVVEQDEAGVSPSPTGSSTGTTPPPPPPSDDGPVPPPPPPDPLDDGGISCPAGYHPCSGACVGNTDPTRGCGSAACTACALAHATAGCTGSACSIAACDPGFADCNANPADGCETDLSKPTSCGGCSAVCPPAMAFCVPQGATYACSNGCTPAAPLLCGKDCVDPLTSTNHCGACDHKCPDVPNSTTSCAAGICGFTCKANYHACAGACVPTSSPTACGAACTDCTAAPNVGTATCGADTCKVTTCKPGFGDCDLDPANGCEANVDTDAAHCGKQCKACGAGETCVAGACKAGDAGP